jgi:sulfate permease, SulP family
VLPVLTIGLVGGLIEVVSAVSYASLVFAGDLSGFVGYGIGLALLATVVNAAVLAWRATLPGTVAGVQDVPAVIMAVAAAAIAQRLGSQAPPEQVFMTVVTAIGITTVVTGLALYALGHFRLGRIVRFVPYPVVGGILAGTGWLLATGAIVTMTDQPLGAALWQADLLAKLIPGVLFAVALLVVHERSSHPLVLPSMVLAGTMLFHAVMFAAGRSLADLSAQGWLLGPFSDQGLWRPYAWSDFDQVHWPSIAVQAATLATVPVLSALALLANVTGLESAVRREVDLNRELKAVGIGNVATGSAGGFTGYHLLGVTALNHRAGAASRFTPLVTAGVCAVALFGGAPLMQLFPRVVVGGLLMFLGLSFLLDWVWKTRRSLPRIEHAIIAVTVLATALLGFLEAVAVGVAAAVILFVVHYSKVDVVRQTLSGARFHSRVVRSAAHGAVLRSHGDAIGVFELQGYLFFGTAARLLAQVRRRLDDPDLPPLRHVLLDLRRVTGADSTVAVTLDKLRDLLQPRRVVLVVTDASPAVAAQLDAVGLREAADCRRFSDLDHGLEWCESELLEAAGAPAEAPGHEPSLHDFLAGWQLESGQIDRLAGYLRRDVLAPGQWLMRQGMEADHLYLLVSGQLTTQLGPADGSQRPPLRLSTQRGAQIVGEIGFYLGQPRSADVKADTTSVIYRLSADAMRRMEREDPALASALHRIVVHRLAARVTHLTDAVNALQR